MFADLYHSLNSDGNGTDLGGKRFCNKQFRFFSYVPILVLVCTGAALLGCSAMITPCRQQAELRFNHQDLNIEESRGLAIRISALNFSQDGQSIWVGYDDNQLTTPDDLAQVEIPDLKVSHHIILERLAADFTQLSRNNYRVIGLVPHECPDIPCHKNDSCWAEAVWDTTSGKNVSVGPRVGTNVHDVALSEDGRWVVLSEGSASIFDPTKDFHGTGIVLEQERGLREIVTGRLNSNGTILVLGIRDTDLSTNQTSGAVAFRAWIEETSELTFFQLGPMRIYRGETHLQNPPLQLSIAPNDRWVAVQTTAELKLLEIENPFFQRNLVNLSQNGKGVLVFDPSSSRLAFGNLQGITVFSVPDAGIPFQNRDIGVSAIAYSPDGCLLAWGDVEGTVHIINAPKP